MTRVELEKFRDWVRAEIKAEIHRHVTLQHDDDYSIYVREAEETAEEAFNALPTT